ncbi:Hpt domain-containing protein [Leucothrix pacifica]|uniref:HPt domain-containing protein n=1 Tax=Leucothrix pacifica TaxID=1247513 RepID=A0A317CH99_9GAMM|nr:Hpt domain-containing protein [Leucothrix pacifica]PWQ97739.1 hypothetical protein DKW60_10240 [Leucothrix pacifica]
MDDLLDTATFDGMKELLEDEFPSFLEMFFSENQDALDRIKTGLSDSNADEIRAAAHNLKSSTGYLGAMKLSELAKHMEEKAAAGDISGLDSVYTQAQTMLDTIKTQVS